MIGTLYTQIQDRSLVGLCTGTAMDSGVVKLASCINLICESQRFTTHIGME